MSIVFLDKALYTKLTADTELVSLVGHTVSNLRIHDKYPDMMVSYPCVAFWYETHINAIDTLDEFKKTTYNIAVWVKITDSATYNGWTTSGKLLCNRIADRIEKLFSPGDQQSLDISTDQIKSLCVLVKNRLPIRLENDLDVYRTDIVVEVHSYEK